MSSSIVLDCSATIGIFFEDEKTEYHNELLEILRVAKGYVPDLWPIEVGNVFITCERRKRITAAQNAHFSTLLGTLNIEIVPLGNIDKLGKIMSIARGYDLTFYDAQYLYLALELSLPLATVDKALIKAAEKAGITVI